MNITTFITTITTIISIAFSVAGLASDININANENDVAIHGYDPVAYFTNSVPVKGTADHAATYNSATYYFSSNTNRDSFRANPEKYAPQFGGFCAMGVALNKKLDVDPTAWKIVDGKLYLNLNKAVQKKWASALNENIVTANRVWHGIENITIATLNAE